MRGPVSDGHRNTRPPRMLIAHKDARDCCRPAAAPRTVCDCAAGGDGDRARRVPPSKQPRSLHAHTIERLPYWSWIAPPRVGVDPADHPVHKALPLVRIVAEDLRRQSKWDP
eukprot:CAMPEP_0174760528 /NCGR_PEP_ID=MMETSP1094-20130205/108817_1 /TAXON_ID=156173 /ORGANISM="Chrysochromulina brevifilum, Strain UTEX LB 985" /LENGTH=111 /DNA_ID=CAMNT_0015966469 /DNA_START=556 /DNA_END=891 /DNA_ORIENTATION=+